MVHLSTRKHVLNFADFACDKIYFYTCFSMRVCAMRGTKPDGSLQGTTLFKRSMRIFFVLLLADPEGWLIFHDVCQDCSTQKDCTPQQQQVIQQKRHVCKIAWLDSAHIANVAKTVPLLAAQ